MESNPNSHENQNYNQRPYINSQGMMPNPLIPGNPNYGMPLPSINPQHHHTSHQTTQIQEDTSNRQENKFNIETGETSYKIETSSHKTSEKTITKKHYETSNKFKLKKQVYDNVLAALKDHDKAILYSNIWYNITFMKNKYSKEIEEVVNQYKPDEYEIN